MYTMFVTASCDIVIQTFYPPRDVLLPKIMFQVIHVALIIKERIFIVAAVRDLLAEQPLITVLQHILHILAKIPVAVSPDVMAVRIAVLEMAVDDIFHAKGVKPLLNRLPCHGHGGEIDHHLEIGAVHLVKQMLDLIDPITDA